LIIATCRCINGPRVIGTCPVCKGITPYFDEADVIAAEQDDAFCRAVAEKMDRELCDHERLLELAKRNPPPERWWNEDFSGLRDPFVSLREQQAKLREHNQ
jgi:hypothetical protein